MIVDRGDPCSRSQQILILLYLRQRLVRIASSCTDAILGQPVSFNSVQYCTQLQILAYGQSTFLLSMLQHGRRSHNR